MNIQDNQIWAPRRGGLSNQKIQFPGFPENRSSLERKLHPAECVWLDLAKGSILRLAINPQATLAITCLNGQKAIDFSVIGLEAEPKCQLNSDSFNSYDCKTRLNNRNIDLDSIVFAQLTYSADDIQLAINENMTVIMISLVDNIGLIEGNRGGSVCYQINSPGHYDVNHPEPLGRIRDEFTIERGTAKAYEVKKGESIQVIDVEGRQCSDFMAMNSHSLDQGFERYIDSTITRTLMGGAYPMPGLFDKFFDQDMKPLLALIQDTVGRHDTFALACTARGYEDRGFPGHLNCSDNISAAYKPFGIQAKKAWPAINFFFNSWIYPDDNRISSDEAWSRPGDYVLMQALNDLTCVSTACPDDVDPINGWNPTDIHVRIYESSLKAKKLTAYRATTDAEPIMTKESPFHSKTSQLTRHYSVARDYWMPQVFDATGAIEEYWACHQTVTIQDMSSLRKLDVMGPDSERLLQLAVSRDVSRLAVNRGFYALLLDERGSVIDDGTLFRLSNDVFRWCCGSDDSADQLAKLAQSLDLNVWIKDLSSSLCNIAIQGPKSKELLRQFVFTRSTQPEFDNIKWFGFAIARLHDREGRPFMLARSGYTGQLGYEIFCDQQDAELIWDTVMEAGEGLGLKVMGNQALDMVRVEAGLMAAGAEFTDDVDADESGLSFAIDMKKEAFIGREALERNRIAPRRKLIGLIFDGDEVPHHGDGIFVNRRQVGIITSAIRSPALSKVIAMARVAIEYSDVDTELAVGKLDGHMKRLPCRVCGVPFIDPAREKPRV